MSEEFSLASLFLSGLISATLLPGGSEVMLGWFLNEGQYSALHLWLAVTSGNALGGMITFFMGWWIATYYPLKAFDKPHHLRAKKWVEKYGAFSLLLSWVPLIGDPLCLLAGWLKTRLFLSLVMITLGKGLRYLILVGIF